MGSGEMKKWSNWLFDFDTFPYMVITTLIFCLVILLTIPTSYVIQNQSVTYEYFEVDNMDCVKIFYKGNNYVSCDWSSK